MTTFDSIGHVKLRVAYLQHNHGKPSTSKQLLFHKTMDLVRILELTH
jgi:hypothetical protein